MRSMGKIGDGHLTGMPSKPSQLITLLQTLTTIVLPPNEFHSAVVSPVSGFTLFYAHLGQEWIFTWRDELCRL